MMMPFSAMADACKEAACQSPIPGPLEKVTTWVLLTELGCKLQQRVCRSLQDHELHVVIVKPLSREKKHVGDC